MIVAFILDEILSRLITFFFFVFHYTNYLYVWGSSLGGATLSLLWIFAESVELSGKTWLFQLINLTVLRNMAVNVELFPIR